MADLFEDRGLWAVGYAGGEFEAADDGAGVHHESLWRMGGKALTGELVGVLVLGEVDLESRKAFGLDTEHHDDLGLPECGFEVALDGDARTGVGGGVGQELCWSAEDDASAEARQQEHVGAGDAAVKDVADDGDGDSGEGGRQYCGFLDCARPASFAQDDSLRCEIEMGQDRAEVQESLRGVLVHAIAGVKDGEAGFLLEEPGSAGGVVADDDGFGSEGAKGEARVLECLAFLDARGEAGDEGRVGAKGLGGKLEAGAGARGGLVEEQGDAALEKDAVAGERVLIFESCGAGEEVADRGEIEVHHGEQRAGIVGE